MLTIVTPQIVIGGRHEHTSLKLLKVAKAHTETPTNMTTTLPFLSPLLFPLPAHIIKSYSFFFTCYEHNRSNIHNKKMNIL